MFIQLFAHLIKIFASWKTTKMVFYFPYFFLYNSAETPLKCKYLYKDKTYKKNSKRENLRSKKLSNTIGKLLKPKNSKWILFFVILVVSSGKSCLSHPRPCLKDDGIACSFELENWVLCRQNFCYKSLTIR